MRQLRHSILCVSIFLCGSAATFAEEKIDFEITADFYSKYIWRGQNLSDDPVFQSGLSAGYKDFTLGIWGNMDLTNINGNSGDFSELDYSLDYSGALPGVKGLGYSVGVIYYDFPGTGTNDTTEIYVGLNFDLPFNPSLTLYHDIDEAEGSYISLAAGKRFEKVFELAPDVPVGLDINAHLGWGSGSYNNYYWGTDQSKLQDFAFSASLPVGLGNWTAAPTLNYVTLLSDDIRDTDAYGTDSDFFFVGIRFSRAF